MADEQQAEVKTIADQLGVDGAQIAALMQLGFASFQQGKLKQARDIFEGLLVLNPINPYPYSMLGSIAQLEKRYDYAVECFNVALKMCPQDINTLTNRGEVFLNMGKLDEAAADLKAAIDLDPQLENPAANRARFLAAFTVEALKLADEKGMDAVKQAAERLHKQLEA